jgi:Porin PorA
MRRLVGPILVGIGAFLFVVGLLSRFYAYGNLAVAPIDQNSVTKLSAEGATIFDVGSLSEKTTDLAIQDKTVGDVKATKAQNNDHVRIWVDTVSYRDSDGNVVSRSAERFAFDKHTGEAINCCGEFLEDTDGERTPIKHKGLIDKWPFQTEKKSYQLWNSTLGAAIDAKYVKQTSIKGLTVYQFEADVPKSTVGTMDVPGSVVGVPDTPTVTAQLTYTDNSTYWIEPQTGAIIDRSSNVLQTLSYQGVDKAITTKGVLHYTDAQVAQNVKDYKSKSSGLKLVHTVLPLVGVIGGLLLVIAGSLLGRRQRSGKRVRTADDPA